MVMLSMKIASRISRIHVVVEEYTANGLAKLNEVAGRLIGFADVG